MKSSRFSQDRLRIRQLFRYDGMEVAALDNFRKNLRTALREKGISQSQLAEAVGTTQPYVNRVLQGTSTPSLEFADKMAKGVGMPLVALLSSPDNFDEAVLTAIHNSV